MAIILKLEHFKGNKGLLSPQYGWIVDWEFGLLEKHRIEVNRNFVTFMAEAEARFRQGTEERNARIVLFEGFEEIAGEDLTVEYEEATKFLPRLQWNAQFLIAFATFENVVCALADILQKKMKQSISYREFKGTGFESALKYILKVGEFGQALQTSEWNAARKFQRLRNVIAHSGGEYIYTTDKDALHAVLKQFPGWSLDQQKDGQASEIALTSAFVEKAIELLRDAAIQLCLAKLPAPPA